MTGTHFDAAVTAITRALGTRLAPGVTTFSDLFTDDGVIAVPIEGDGLVPPIRGRAALTAMVASLDGTLRFDEVTVTHVYDAEPRTIVCEYEALLHRSDLDGYYRRRYVSIMRLRDGRIQHTREYGGPLMPAESTARATP